MPVAEPREVDDRLHDRRLADARAAGDHHAAVAQRGLDRLPLLRRASSAPVTVSNAWIAAPTSSGNVARGRPRAAPRAARPTRPRHRTALAATLHGPRCPSTSRTISLALLERAQPRRELVGVRSAAARPRRDQLVVGQVHVAVLGAGLERMQQARFEPLGCIARHPELLRDRIRGAKPDAPHLVREAIRIRADDVDRVLAVLA